MDQLSKFPPPTHNTKRIVLVIIISVILIALLVAGILFFIKYSNFKEGAIFSESESLFDFDHYVSKFGVEINYPKGWQIKEVAGELGAGIYFFPPNIDISKLSEFDLDESNQSLSISFITFFDEGQSFNLERNLLKSSERGQLIEKKNITINDRPATLFYYKINNTNFRSLVTETTGGNHRVASIVTYKAPAEIYSDQEAQALISSFKDNILESIIAHEKEEQKKRIEHKQYLVNQMGDIVVNYLPAFVKADPSSSASSYSLIQHFTCNNDLYKTFTITKTVPDQPSSWGQTLEERVAGWQRGKNDVIEIDVNQNKGFWGKYRGSPDVFDVAWSTPDAYFFLQNSSCNLSEEEILKIARSIK